MSKLSNTEALVNRPDGPTEQSICVEKIDNGFVKTTRTYGPESCEVKKVFSPSRPPLQGTAPAAPQGSSNSLRAAKTALR